MRKLRYVVTENARALDLMLSPAGGPATAIDGYKPILHGVEAWVNRQNLAVSDDCVSNSWLRDRTVDTGESKQAESGD